MQLSRPLDGIDRKIVALLQESAKRTFADIGADVGLSATAVKRRVDRLENDGVITGYGARINWRALGEAIESLIEIYCADRTSPADVGRSLAQVDEIVSAFTVSGEADAVIRVRVDSIEHLERLVERLRRDPNIVQDADPDRALDAARPPMRRRMTPLLELQTFASPDIEMERRPDGTIILVAQPRCREWEPSITAVLRKRAARASGPPARRPARRRGSLDDAHLRRGAAEGGRAGAGVRRTRPRAREAGDDPVGQLARAPAGQPRRLRRRRAGDADQRRLLADEHRPRADQGDRGADRAGARVRRRRRAVRRRPRRARGLVPQALVARGERRGRAPPRRAVASRARDDSPLDGEPGPDTIAKLLFTSGSTGVPKGVINTHRMLCSNQAMHPGDLAVPAPTSHRCWSTGCRGATRSAATTT